MTTDYHAEHVGSLHIGITAMPFFICCPCQPEELLTLAAAKPGPLAIWPPADIGSPVRDGLTMNASGWAYALEDYGRALEGLACSSSACRACR